MGSATSIARQAREICLRLLFDRKVPGSIDLGKPIKILFDQKENLIGDMLVNTVAFRAIKQGYPNWEVHVLAGVDNREVVANNPHVDRVYEYDGLRSTARRLREQQFDVFYYHKNRMRLSDYYLLNRVKAEVNIGRDKEGFELFDYSVTTSGKTEVDRYTALLDLLGIKTQNYCYEFPLGSDCLSDVKDWLSRSSGSPLIVFNRYGSPGGKRFSIDCSIRLVREIVSLFDGAQIILLCPPDFKAETHRIEAALSLANVRVADFTRSITDSAAVIYHADLVVSPDTSVVHIACAYEKPQICVYRDRGELELWRPQCERAITLLPLSPSRHVDDVDMSAFKVALQEIKSRWFQR